MIKRSCKGSSCIGYLEERINEIDYNSDTSRNGKFNRAIIKTQSCTLEELKTLTEVEENVMSALNLTTLQTKYEVELMWFIYMCELQKDVMEVGEKKIKEKDLTGPEMVKRLVEILMLNREQDKEVIEEIKSILLKWEV